MGTPTTPTPADTNPLTNPPLISSKQIVNHPTRKTARCTSCNNVFRLWIEGPVTVAMPHAQFRFCPICGQPSLLTSIDLDLDYWEILGSTYNYPAYIIRAIFDSWPTHEYKKFGDYVQALKDELAANAATDSITATNTLQGL